MPVYSMNATMLTGMMLYTCFLTIACTIITRRFPRTKGKVATTLLSGWRWLLWFILCLAISMWGISLSMSQSSDDILYEMHVKTVAQDRQGNAYIVLNDGQTRQCAVATECIALPDNSVVTYRWERHGDRSLMRIVGKG